MTPLDRGALDATGPATGAASARRALVIQNITRYGLRTTVQAPYERAVERTREELPRKDSAS